MLFSELKCKEVICVSDGRRLGFVSDVRIKMPEGVVCDLIVPGPCRFVGLIGRQDDFVIPWSCICQIGPDIILVDVHPEDCRKPRPKGNFFF